MHRLNSFFFSGHLEEEEEVRLVVHKHWLVGLKFLMAPTVSVCLAIILLYTFESRSSVVWLFYGAAAWATISIVWWLRNFFDYYLDAWVITDQGIIDVEWHGWFHRQSSRVLYSDIQGVSYEIQGVLATLMRYGEIAVEKISTGNTISMEHVSRPWRIEKLILQCMEDYMHSKNLKDAKHVQDILANVIAREMHLRGLGEGEEGQEDEDDES